MPTKDTIVSKAHSILCQFDSYNSDFQFGMTVDFETNLVKALSLFDNSNFRVNIISVPNLVVEVDNLQDKKVP